MIKSFLSSDISWWYNDVEQCGQEVLCWVRASGRNAILSPASVLIWFKYVLVGCCWIYQDQWLIWFKSGLVGCCWKYQDQWTVASLDSSSNIASYISESTGKLTKDLPVLELYSCLSFLFTVICCCIGYITYWLCSYHVYSFLTWSTWLSQANRWLNIIGINLTEPSQ